jgi:CRISPR/Cas system-associated exonuclease Cas4 (RecB family)
MSIESLANEIILRRENELKSKQKVYRQDRPRASSISRCDREMYLSITDFVHHPPYDTRIIARFEEGNRQESFILQLLIKNGFTVVEGQIDLSIKDRNERVVLTGHIDGKIEWEEKRIPFEVKSMNPNIYEDINTVEDFNKRDWTKRYILQMQSYLFANNEPEGIFIITDCLGHFKILPVKLDYDLMEKIIQRCTHVMDCVEKNEPPDFIKDASICRRCWAFGRVCTPPISNEGCEIISDIEIEEQLKLREQSEEARKTYELADKNIKGYFKNKPKAICGDYMVTGELRTRTTKPTEGKTTEYWQTTIEKLGEKTNESNTQKSDL